jgi:hypothetical protein
MRAVVEQVAGALERANVGRMFPHFGDMSDVPLRRRSIDAAVGAVVGSVAHQMGDAGGARAVWSLVAGDHGWLLDSRHEGHTRELAGLFFGSSRTVIERRLVHHTGLDHVTTAAFLSTVLAVYLEHLRRTVVEHRLDVAGLRALVADHRDEAARSVPLTDLFTTVARPADDIHDGLRRIRAAIG